MARSPKVAPPRSSALRTRAAAARASDGSRAPKSSVRRGAAGPGGGGVAGGGGSSGRIALVVEMAEGGGRAVRLEMAALRLRGARRVGHLGPARYDRVPRDPVHIRLCRRVLLRGGKRLPVRSSLGQDFVREVECERVCQDGVQGRN